MKDMLLAVGTGVVTIWLLFSAIASGITKSEIVECLKWKDHAAQIKNFWLTPAERSQCEAVGVDVSEIKSYVE